VHRSPVAVQDDIGYFPRAEFFFVIARQLVERAAEVLGRPAAPVGAVATIEIDAENAVAVGQEFVRQEGKER